MLINRLVTDAHADLLFIFKSKWKLVVFALIGVIYLICWASIRKTVHTPLKSNLLIGERLVGRASLIIDPEIPLLSPYGYDSQFFWALSVDPFLQNNFIIKSIDSPAYRSQRLLLPFLTWSIIRNPANIIYGLWFWCLIGYGLGFVSIIKLCNHFNISAIVPLSIYTFNPGMVIALIHPMSDVLATGLFLFGLSQWINSKKWIACLFFMLACLAREYTAVYIFSIAVFTCWTKRSINIKQILPLIISGIPMVAWQIYIRWNQGVWASSQLIHGFDWPFLGTFKYLRRNMKGNFISKDLIGAICLHLACILVLLNLNGMKKNLLLFLTISNAVLLTFSGEAIMESDWSYVRGSILFVTFTSMVFLMQEIKSDSKAALHS
ncbi:MAG: hypothetical protein ABI761_09205 [Saprospiraceae bacterium]